MLCAGALPSSSLIPGSPRFPRTPADVQVLSAGTGNGAWSVYVGLLPAWFSDQSRDMDSRPFTKSVKELMIVWVK